MMIDLRGIAMILGAIALLAVIVTLVFVALGLAPLRAIPLAAVATPAAFLGLVGFLIAREAILHRLRKH